MELTDLRPRGGRTVALADLVGSGSIVSGADAQITGVTLASTEVRPGDLFVALGGMRQHGIRYAEQAAQAGAVAIASDPEGIKILRSGGVDAPTARELPLVEVAAPRAKAGVWAAKVWPQGGELLTIGVGGTNGKTTTTHFINHCLNEAGCPAVLIGTAGVTFQNTHLESPRTSLEAPDLHRVLAWAAEQGARAAVMEVSSHALSMHRMSGVKLTVAAFLNLQRDHLDFHHTMEEYFAAKARLYTPQHCEQAVICVDDRWGALLSEECTVTHLTVTTATSGADRVLAGPPVPAGVAGSDFTVNGPGEQSVQMHSPLPGMINVQNALVAHTCLLAAGFDGPESARALAGANRVPGRMEVVGERSEVDPLVVVDFAHTPDALEAACRTLTPLTAGDLWCIFGATGERDRGKRPLMGKVVAREADQMVITDDDTYGEDPERIRLDVKGGALACADRRVKCIIEDDDRRHAIMAAVNTARPQDTVLIAGRGHETTQILDGRKVDFDDREVARQALANRAAIAGRCAKPSSAGEDADGRLRISDETCEDERRCAPRAGVSDRQITRNI